MVPERSATGLDPTAIREIAARHGAGNLRVFGSFAHGTQRPDSDLDLLVDLEPGRSLLDLVAVKQDLEDLLGRRVDVATTRSLSPYIRESVLRDAISLSNHPTKRTAYTSSTYGMPSAKSKSTPA